MCGSNEEVDLPVGSWEWESYLGEWGLKSLPVSPGGHNEDPALREWQAHRAQNLEHWNPKIQETQGRERQTLLQAERRGLPNTKWADKCLHSCVDGWSQTGRKPGEPLCAAVCNGWKKGHAGSTCPWNPCAILKLMCSSWRKAWKASVN